MYAGLRGGIARRDGAPHDTFGRAEVDDPPASFLYDGVCRLVRVYGGLEIGVQDQVQVFGFDVSWDAGLPDAGSVDEDVQALKSSTLRRTVSVTLTGSKSMMPRHCGPMGWR
jgi:hypothetical protein